MKENNGQREEPIIIQTPSFIIQTPSFVTVFFCTDSEPYECWLLIFWEITFENFDIHNKCATHLEEFSYLRL